MSSWLFSKHLSFLFRDYLWSIFTTKPLFHFITVNGAHGYTFDIMVDEFLTVVIAGMETTANSMAMTFMELGRQPHIVRKWVLYISLWVYGLILWRVPLRCSSNDVTFSRSLHSRIITKKVCVQWNYICADVHADLCACCIEQ